MSGRCRQKTLAGHAPFCFARTLLLRVSTLAASSVIVLCRLSISCTKFLLVSTAQLVSAPCQSEGYVTITQHMKGLPVPPWRGHHELPVLLCISWSFQIPACMMFIVSYGGGSIYKPLASAS